MSGPKYKYKPLEKAIVGLTAFPIPKNRYLKSVLTHLAVADQDTKKMSTCRDAAVIWFHVRHADWTIHTVLAIQPKQKVYQRTTPTPGNQTKTNCTAKKTPLWIHIQWFGCLSRILNHLFSQTILHFFMSNCC